MVTGILFFQRNKVYDSYYANFVKYVNSFDWVFVFQVRNEWDELDDYQREFSMKNVINLLVLAGKNKGPKINNLTLNYSVVSHVA